MHGFDIAVNVLKTSAMSFITAVQVSILSFFVTTMANSQLSAKNRLMSDLLSNYNKDILPSENDDRPLNLSVGIEVMDVIDLDERTETLEVIFMLAQMWHDVRFHWDPKDYSNVTILAIPTSSVWIPDLLPFNSVESFLAYQDVLTKVTNEGLVTWYPPVRLRSRCAMDLARYPWDEQNCTVTFGSWMYDGGEVNLTNGNVDLNMYTERKEWKIVAVEGTIINKKFECCPSTYPILTATIRFRRNPLFVTRMVIIPGMLLALLVPFQMLLPPGSNERMTLGSVLVFALLFLDLRLQDIVPVHHTTSPPIQMFLLLAQVWNILSVLLSVLILNFCRRGVRQSHVPPVIKMIFVDVLKRLLCMTDNQTPIKGLDNPAIDPDWKSERPAPQSRTPGDDAEVGRHTQVLVKIEECLSRMLEYVDIKRDASAAEADAKRVVSEWREVALVFDRLLFIGSFITFFLCSVTLLT